MQERLRDLEVGQAGMSRWLDQLIILQEKVDKLHQVCDSDLGPNYEAMLLQKKETEVREYLTRVTSKMKMIAF